MTKIELCLIFHCIALCGIALHGTGHWPLSPRRGNASTFMCQLTEPAEEVDKPAVDSGDVKASKVISLIHLNGHYASSRGTYLINELPSSRGEPFDRMAVEERDETRNELSETGHAAESNDCLSFDCDGVTKAQQHPTNACPVPTD
ncbi:hypothetical protein HZ326_4462 [Fusarium oxysporum f. sp. albedinis]|nr:hypothetical protein HZ326_4462 [Fusarium oxysporum f. sp. albedinis]